LPKKLVIMKKSLSPPGGQSLVGNFQLMNKKKEQPSIMKNIKLTINRIRKSPSPPHQGGDLMNQKPALASDFIKSMIQKKDKQDGGVKKVGILAGKIGAQQSKKIKIRRSPNREEQEQLKKKMQDAKAKAENPLDFTTDMKRIGIMDDIKEGQEKQKKLIIKQRHVSPPPPVSNIGPLFDPLSSVNHNSEAKLDCDIKDDTPNQNTKKIKIHLNKNQKAGQSLFKFPFQRRARSLSLPKDEDGNDVESENAPVVTENQQKQEVVAMKM
jgi:hypothetical protein